MSERASRHLARNLRQLRDARGWTQHRLASLAEVPRATLAHLESGSGNPTLAVLLAIAQALQVSIDALIGPPRPSVQHWGLGDLPLRRKGGVDIRGIWPDGGPHLEVERFELSPGARMSGVPHTVGTREVLACETGGIEVILQGEVWSVAAGEVLSFPGDQRHGYRNPGASVAIAYSIVALPTRTA